MTTMSSSTIKRESRSEILLERNLLTREYLLRLNKRLCDGCGLCSENCPKEAVKWNPPLVVAGRLMRKPTVDFDVDKCILCGECAIICPLDALRMEIDGVEIATIVKNEAFPVLLKEVTVTKEKCKPECKLVCQKECPTRAINALTKASKKGSEIIEIQINESFCIYCKRCESACPFQAIIVKKPFAGKVQLDTTLCPKDCMACVDICPAQAIQLNEDKKPLINLNFCVNCFACEKVCPEKAIHVERQWIYHSEVNSAVWLTALAKLTSIETVTKELASDSGRKRAVRVYAHQKSIIEQKFLDEQEATDSNE